MSTLEHLFMQIFDRKGWIEEQLRQQVESYGQSLAYNLAAAGRHPQPWLWDNGSGSGLSGCSNPIEFNGKQIIPDMLFPQTTWITTPASRNTYFTLPNYKITEFFQNNFIPGTCVSTEALQEDQIDKYIPNIQSKENSCLDQPTIDQRVSEIDPLSMIQRSRSRQRDIEIRLSARAKSTTSNVSTKAVPDSACTGSRVCSLKPSGNKESLVKSIVPDSIELQLVVPSENPTVEPKRLVFDGVIENQVENGLTELSLDELVVARDEDPLSQKGISENLQHVSGGSSKRNPSETIFETESHEQPSMVIEEKEEKEERGRGNPLPLIATEEDTVSVLLSDKAEELLTKSDNSETSRPNPKFSGSKVSPSSEDPNPSKEGNKHSECNSIYGNCNNNKGIRGSLTSGKYFLRSSTSRENSNLSIRPGETNESIGQKHSWEKIFISDINSWPKRRKVERALESALGTGPRMGKEQTLAQSKVASCSIEKDQDEEADPMLLEHSGPPSSPTIHSGEKESVPVQALAFSESKQAEDPNDSQEIDMSISTSSDRDIPFTDSDDTLPELEGFGVSISPNMEGETGNLPSMQILERERASLLAQLSSKYNLDMVSHAYQSVPNSLMDFIRPEGCDSSKRLRASENGNFSSASCLFGYTGLETDIDISFSSQSSSRPPLTPPAEKFSQWNNLSGKSRSGNGNENNSCSGNGTVGSNPELTCFRIDENSSIMEEGGADNNNNNINNNINNNDNNVFRAKMENDRKALQDITLATQNSEKILPEEGYKMRESTVRSSVNGNGVRMVSDSGRVVSGKVELTRKGSERNVERGSSKPSNIVANVFSFVPVVRQKQQQQATVTNVNGKKDIRVKALEAAEMAKRLEEKKQNEREKRKLATKVERERLKLEREREMKRKQEEEEQKRMKKEAELAERKRLREDEERREKERKRRCIEKDREKEKARVVKKEERETRKKVPELKEERNGESCMEQQPNMPKEVVGPSSVHIASETIEAQETSKQTADFEKGNSYEMSPYKDSDDEEGDKDDDEQDEARRSKYVPLWARREYLHGFLLSKRDLDPVQIFSRKSSFSLNEVLSPHMLNRKL